MIQSLLQANQFSMKWIYKKNISNYSKKRYLALLGLKTMDLRDVLEFEQPTPWVGAS